RSGAARLIFLLTVLFLALFFGLIAYAAWHDRERAMGDARRSAVDLAKLLSEHVSRLIETADLVLMQTQLLEQRVDWADPADDARFQAHLAESRAQLPYIANILATGPDGGVRAEAETTNRATVAGRAFFVAHQSAENLLFVGDPARDPDSGEVSFVLSRRQSGRGGAFKGVVAIEMRADYFNQLFHDLDADYAAVIELVLPDLSLLLREPPLPAADLRGARKNPIFRTMIQASRTGTALYASPYDPEPRLQAYRQAGSYPVYVNVGISPQAVLEEWQSRVLPQFAILAIAWLGFVAISWVAYQRACNEDRFRTALWRATRDLEIKVRQRTESLEQTVDKLSRTVGEKETLFQELNHRVKNNLQLISSLLSLQAGKIKDPQARRGFEVSLDRVHSISLVHDLLYRRADITYVDVPTYLKALIARIATAYLAEGRIECTVDADPLSLLPDQCIRLALIVNEVVTNAVKHAFPDGRTGHITVTFRRTEAALRLSVTDDGVGIAPPEAEGDGAHLGMTIVELLAKYLGGSCQQVSGAFGTIVTVSFPVPADAA
ncbi:MAG: ATP-binding protein, partial [Proteobacteria bacterium]|nr:ATP-binding protein [Pseudomonadota bacterium]